MGPSERRTVYQLPSSIQTIRVGQSTVTPVVISTAPASGTTASNSGLRSALESIKPLEGRTVYQLPRSIQTTDTQIVIDGAPRIGDPLRLPSMRGNYGPGSYNFPPHTLSWLQMRAAAARNDGLQLPNADIKTNIRTGRVLESGGGVARIGGVHIDGREITR
jgi:uncharacterized protein involved in outer membrane biogenesis